MDLPRPSERVVEGAMRLLEPWRRTASPVCLGLGGIPRQGPTLFVGNHSLFGVLDAPLLIMELYRERGILLRGLADHAHFQVPRWGELLQAVGAVDGTRENCAALMEAGERILVFPGGAREVMKNRDEVYKLLWGRRIGFARMAIRHGCPVVPFAAVGIDDAYDIVVDRNDILASPLGRLLTRAGLRPDLIMPVAFGIGPTPLPRPERVYFHFGAPIDPGAFAEGDEAERAWALREAAASAIEAGIEVLLAHRAQDPYRRLLPRVKRALRP